ncbi:MAG: thioesterase family protein [Verrucomicrobiota bacterium]
MKLVLPESFAFATDIPVRITDINYGGHLGNDALLGLLHEARVRFLHEMGYTEIDIEGRSLIMRNVEIVFAAEAFAGDVLRVEVAVSACGRAAFDVLYRVSHKTKGHEVARARTGMVFFDYDQKKVVRGPEGFAEKCS